VAVPTPAPEPPLPPKPAAPKKSFVEPRTEDGRYRYRAGDGRIDD
jgi:hypothetical protein